MPMWICHDDKVEATPIACGRRFCCCCATSDPLANRTDCALRVVTTVQLAFGVCRGERFTEKKHQNSITWKAVDMAVDKRNSGRGDAS